MTTQSARDNGKASAWIRFNTTTFFFANLRANFRLVLEQASKTACISERKLREVFETANSVYQLRFTMVIELSGVQFGLKSNA